MTENFDWSAEIYHFKPEEFDDPDLPGSWEYMDERTIQLLDELREATGWPIVTHNKFGIHGCVAMTKGHHSPNSLHNYDNLDGCSAVDFHFMTAESVRAQAQAVICSGFSGIGVYQDQWRWSGEILPVGFHVDKRKRFQIWKRVEFKHVLIDGKKWEYIYLID